MFTGLRWLFYSICAYSSDIFDAMFSVKHSVEEVVIQQGMIIK